MDKPPYICVDCFFYTELKSNYTRHLNTKKHKMIQEKLDKAENRCIKCEQNIFDRKLNFGKNISSRKSLKIKIELLKSIKSQIKKNFFCKYCSKGFTTHAHKRRHELHRCKKRNLENELINNKII